MTTSMKSFRVDCSYCEIGNTISDLISQLSRRYFSSMTIKRWKPSWRNYWRCDSRKTLWLDCNKTFNKSAPPSVKYLWERDARGVRSPLVVHPARRVHLASSRRLFPLFRSAFFRAPTNWTPERVLPTPLQSNIFYTILVTFFFFWHLLSSWSRVCTLYVVRSQYLAPSPI